MKGKSALLWLIALPLLWTAAAAGASEETRSIYVGDIITLEIMTRDFSTEALKEPFQDFEIVEVRDIPGGVSLSLRTFETGKHKVLLGGTEVILEVRSTLDEIQREGIFEEDPEATEAGQPFDGRIPFGIAAGVFMLSGGFVLLKALRRKMKKAPSPLQLFLRRAAALSMDDGHFLVEATRCFKEYLEALHQCRIIGKTSAEIIAELEGIQALRPILPEARAWLRECDRLKFTGVAVSKEDAQRHYEELLSLAAKIDAQKEGAV